ncbi:MAG: hypothetical protein H6Q18_170 [Bacteroidetes bacterium]|nr:hypothetical protein [Bacteroidota bacterium]
MIIRRLGFDYKWRTHAFVSLQRNNNQKKTDMKQINKIEIFEKLDLREMSLLKGGFSSNEQATEQEVYVIINGKRYRISKEGLQPA